MFWLAVPFLLGRVVSDQIQVSRVKKELAGDAMRARIDPENQVRSKLDIRLMHCEDGKLYVGYYFPLTGHFVEKQPADNYPEDQLRAFHARHDIMHKLDPKKYI